MNRVEEFLKHFDVQPYDPVKAHEYYMKTRQLKGRGTSGLSDKQKEAWVYSKDQITEDKKKQATAAKAENDKKIEAFRQTAEATRARISEKLKLLNEKLTAQAESQRKEIADHLEQELAKVAPIPKGISAAQRAILVEKRDKEIEAIRGAADMWRGNVTKDTKASKKAGSDDASTERTKTATDLKTIISSTRDAYTKAKAELDANYEKTYQKEYDKVLNTIAGKPKPKAKAKAAPKEKKGGIIYYNGKGPTR